MIAYLKKKHTSLPYRILSGFIAFTFTFSLVLPPTYAQLLPQTVLNLPVPGTMVPPSSGFAPALMTGVTIHPDNPLRFDFIMDRGQSDLTGEPLKEEYTKMIKYFMASLTVPEDELWVNLSPHEKDRMIAAGLGKTEMGRDMLAQDYLLKQLTASLMYPEKELGKTFWDRVYKKAQEQFGTTEIPVNTFNKVWIVPDEALVYEQGTSAFVIKSRLAVMLEEDYVAMNSNVGAPLVGAHDRAGTSPAPTGNNLSISTQIIREIIIPEIEKEVNEGKNFANLRQIYNALILATWYKQKLTVGAENFQPFLGKVYVNQNKTKGIDTQDKEINQKIYDQYIESFQKGVYNFIKEDVDPATQEVIPRKYFSGGMNWKLGLKTLGAFALGTWLGFGDLDVGNAQALAAAMGGNKDGVTTEFVDNANPGDIGTAITVKEGVQPLLLAQKSGVANDERRLSGEAEHESFSAKPEDTIDETASSPVFAVMKFLPAEIGQGVWVGNRFAWEFNSELNRITGGDKTDKSAIAKAMGDLIRTLMSIEGRYNYASQTLSLGKPFQVDNLIKLHRARILDLLSISVTTGMALRNIEVAKEVVESVKLQAVEKGMLDLPRSRRGGYEGKGDVFLKIDNLVDLVKEIDSKALFVQKDFRVRVKEIDYWGEDWVSRAPNLNYIYALRFDIAQPSLEHFNYNDNEPGLDIVKRSPWESAVILSGEQVTGKDIKNFVKKYFKPGEKFNTQQIRESLKLTPDKDNKIDNVLKRLSFVEETNTGWRRIDDTRKDEDDDELLLALIIGSVALSDSGTPSREVSITGSSEEGERHHEAPTADHDTHSAGEESGTYHSDPYDWGDDDDDWASSPVEEKLREGLRLLDEIRDLEKRYAVVVGRMDVVRWKNKRIAFNHKKALEAFEEAIRLGERNNVTAFWIVANQFVDDQTISGLLKEGNQHMETARYFRDNLWRYQTPTVFKQMSDTIGVREANALKLFKEVIIKKKPELLSSSPVQQDIKKVGGIDLNPALLDLQIRRDGNGVPLPLPMQPIENMHIDGFLPVIINIVPITNLPLLLGLDLPPQDEAPVQLTYQELSLVVTPARERFHARKLDEVFI